MQKWRLTHILWHAANQWKFISFSAYLFALFLVAAGKDSLDEIKLPPPAAMGAQSGKQSAIDVVCPKHVSQTLFSGFELGGGWR